MRYETLVDYEPEGADVHQITTGRELVVWILSLGVFALLGRLAYHLYLVRKRKRKCFGWDLVFDGPVVIIAIVSAMAAHEYLDLGPHLTNAVAAWGAYLGPQGFYALLDKYASRRGKKD